ncbi:MAG TPA: hypothetical protein PLI95_14875 [Polyangiaceae bacterium]|nr:hypothetical protein [Polyangiaceae bacterium]
MNSWTYLDLDDEPQLASLAILHSALPIASAALAARHGEPQFPIPSRQPHLRAHTLLLARLVDAHCRSLAELLDAYRTTVALAAAEDDDDKPF